MKTTFLILIFFLYAFYIGAAVLIKPERVYDSSHTSVSSGIRYYILPFPGGGRYNGGITIASFRNTTCPRDVSQELKAFDKGLGVIFHTVNTSASAIRVSTDLTIKFTNSRACAESAFWKVDTYDHLRKRYFVTIGGVKGMQGGITLTGSFRIEKEKNNYKIVYCTQVNCITKPCTPVCNNVGTYHEYGRTLLALADEPLVVKFRKVYRG